FAETQLRRFTSLDDIDIDIEDDPTAELSYLDAEIDPESIKEWELDFCSRPILDIRGKKIWELVVCDSTLSLQYTKFFPNNVINSITIKYALASICDELGVLLPENIRFFRSQMQTIVTKACKELGIKPVPSKRASVYSNLPFLDAKPQLRFIFLSLSFSTDLQCLSLFLWLEERYETVYMRHSGFQSRSKPLLALDNPFPMKLPENLVGEKWAFVQLPFSCTWSLSIIKLWSKGVRYFQSTVQEEAASLERNKAFGVDLNLDFLGIDFGSQTCSYIFSC
ncbi:hypothetical protein GIB67_018781, partial [Kingdonia uniflora]